MHSDHNITPGAVIGQDGYLHTYIWNLANWGIQRNITAEGGATALSQIPKLYEEVDELQQALTAGDKAGIVDGIGDSLVVLIQIARLAGYPLDECLEQAWNEIKDRKGTMVNGIFVKEIV